ncbi:glycosyltransferase family 4 protein [Achromobacter seleniivolatilans]|uniref:Glycosyltransferase family 4 protein n=1 Tax=Achromobacter seleniivolatilans TaxID=3047478 RepID=A0ABY9LY64_9BURK|nr:glycosyltransferase family 4 protein [Achromobacter sp. R39]WMD19380.1 glycosyltransferase family 4 protein [Achromobacter sp. R39]
MPSLFLWCVLAVALAAAWLLTGALRRYALASSRLLDVPNSRSSHVVPTPRGGGVSFVLSFLAGLPVLIWLGLLTEPAAIALGGAGAAVAMIGFLDDRGHVAVRWRLLVHFGSALWLLVWFGGLPADVFSSSSTAWALAASAVGLFALVWLLNLYNFMDGIDGLAASEAICVAGGGAVLYALTGHAGAVAAPLLLAVSVVGFLLWNFPPARIFMGDAGSSFLGIVLGGLALQAAWQDPSLFWAWVILLGVFVVDATWTLARRLARGERVYLAHRMHAYQHATRRFGGHRPVLLTVIALNAVWLFPMALCVAYGWLPAWAGVPLAYGPLLALAIGCKAGEREA